MFLSDHYGESSALNLISAPPYQLKASSSPSHFLLRHIQAAHPESTQPIFTITNMTHSSPASPPQFVLYLSHWLIHRKLLLSSFAGKVCWLRNLFTPSTLKVCQLYIHTPVSPRDPSPAICRSTARYVRQEILLMTRRGLWDGIIHVSLEKGAMLRGGIGAPVQVPRFMWRAKEGLQLTGIVEVT